MLRLPKLLGNGCVLQTAMPVSIWGWGEPGQTVSVSVQGQVVTGTVAEGGSWSVELQPLISGGPYVLSVTASGAEQINREVYVGEVYLCAGQSNMELPMAWIQPEYPHEFQREPDPLLRQYKVVPQYNFEEPQHDHEQAGWSACDEQGLPGFSAIGYFFGRMLRKHLDVPVGLVNVSLGGSPIESWMSAESLRQFPEVLQTLQPYMGQGVAEARSRKSITARDEWYRQLGYEQAPNTGSWLPLGRWEWQHNEADCVNQQAVQWHSIVLPHFFADQGLRSFRGELELRKIIYLPASAASQPAFLRLGTMADAEHTWFNGQLLGGRTNQYEPRDYSIPAGLLREGRNELRIRLVCEHATGRVTPGKTMSLTIDDDAYDLSGTWQYAVLHEVNTDCPWEDFVRWKPIGLYNAMLAPCMPYRIRAVLWYQGESNTGDFASLYRDMLVSLISSWRNGWKQDRLPFLIVQLPNFAIDCVEDGGWPVVREAQWQVAHKVPDTAAVVTLDAGDWNDLHPAHKKPIAERLFQTARQLVYSESVDAWQPQLSGAATESAIPGRSVVLTFEDCPIAADKTSATTQSKPSHLFTIDGHEPGEFTFVWEDGGAVKAAASIDGNRVTLPLPNRTPTELRYAWSNNPDDGLLCNDHGVLVPPFRLSLKGSEA